MNLNIPPESAGKTLDMPFSTEIERGHLSHKVMDVLSEYNLVCSSLETIRKEQDELIEKHNTLGFNNSLAEKALIDLTLNPKLSSIVKSKNKKVISTHNIKINYFPKEILYPAIPEPILPEGVTRRDLPEG